MHMKVAIILLPMWSTQAPPLGINYIGSSLRRDDHDVFVWDYNVQMRKHYESQRTDKEFNLWDGSFALDWNHKGIFNSEILPQLQNTFKYFMLEIASKLRKNKVDAVGFSVYQSNQNTTDLFANYFSKVLPDLKIFYGGPSITVAFPRDNLYRRTVDAYVFNEGEMAARELVANWEGGKSINSIDGVLAVQDDGILSDLVKREQVNMETLPIIDFEDFQLDLYFEKVLPIMMSRGCVALCTFCDEPSYWGKFRWRSPAHIYKELEQNTKKYGVKHFQSMDSLLNGHMRNFKKLADLIVEGELEITFAGNVRISKHMDAEFFRQLKRAGCKYLVFGLECGSQRILDKMKKNIKLEWAIDNFRDCHEAGIEVHANIIVGFPGEEEEDFKMTLSFLDKVIQHIACVNVGVGMSIGPGQDVYMNPESYDILLTEKGNVQFDEKGQWQSKSGSNNHEVRIDRLKRMRAYLENGKDVLINPPYYNPAT